MSKEKLNIGRGNFIKLVGLTAGSVLLSSCARKIDPIATVFSTQENSITPTPFLPETPTRTNTPTLTPTRTPETPTKEDERKFPPPKLMILGDSITKFGFADYLSDALSGEGYQVEFVGSNTSKKNVKNEGHGGFTTIDMVRDLEDGYWSWAGVDTPTRLNDNIPNVLTLELGTNDAGSEFSPEKITIPNFRKIISIFRGINPDVKIIIFPVIPSLFEWDNTVKKINRLFVDLVKEVSTVKSPVALAPDVRGNFDTDKDLVDGIHPTASGYQKMVESCMVVLKKILSLKK